MKYILTYMVMLHGNKIIACTIWKSLEGILSLNSSKFSLNLYTVFRNSSPDFCQSWSHSASLNLRSIGFVEASPTKNPVFHIFTDTKMCSFFFFFFWPPLFFLQKPKLWEMTDSKLQQTCCHWFTAQFLTVSFSSFFPSFRCHFDKSSTKKYF